MKLRVLGLILLGLLALALALLPLVAAVTNSAAIAIFVAAWMLWAEYRIYRLCKGTEDIQKRLLKMEKDSVYPNGIRRY